MGLTVIQGCGPDHHIIDCGGIVWAGHEGVIGSDVPAWLHKATYMRISLTSSWNWVDQAQDKAMQQDASGEPSQEAGFWTWTTIVVILGGLQIALWWPVVREITLG